MPDRALWFIQRPWAHNFFPLFLGSKVSGRFFADPAAPLFFRRRAQVIIVVSERERAIVIAGCLVVIYPWFTCFLPVLDFLRMVSSQGCYYDQLVVFRGRVCLSLLEQSSPFFYEYSYVRLISRVICLVRSGGKSRWRSSRLGERWPNLPSTATPRKVFLHLFFM